MKRRTFISMMSVMAAAGVLTLSGCSNSSTSTAASSGASSAADSAADQLAAIQASGKLIVALEGAWQPWSYHDESDTLVGYDVEVSRAIAEKLGVEPEYVESDWDSLFAGLDAGRFDMVCNGVEVTDERALTYDFTTPYGYIHTALAVRKDNDEIKTFEDLKGKTTANSLASTYMELAESYGATVQGIDTLVGYDVEVSRAIAEKLGVEPEYVESDWDSLFAGLDAGRFDIVCNGVEVTDERSKTYDFTTPYGYIHTALAVRKDNEDIKSFEDLKGKTTANSLASTYMELAESYGATVQGIDTLEETIQLLTAGRIDATLNADVSFYDYLNVHPDANFKLVAQTEEASHVAIPVLKSDDTSFLDALNSAIEALRADGTLKELSEKYFGEDISSEN